MVGIIARTACGTRTYVITWVFDHAQRESRLPLPALDRVHARAEDLGEHGAVVEGEPGDEGGQRLHLEGDEDEEDHHQHGHRPEELHHQRGRPAHRPVGGQPPAGEDPAEDEGEHGGEDEGLERVAEAAQEHLLDALVLEGRPLGGRELVGVEEEVDHPGEDDQDDGGGDDPVEAVAAPGERAGDVVEGGTGGHRATPQRFSSTLKIALMDRVTIR
ncbi:hypothetical protein GCM10020000_15790 [Streptomyces olivoverticillatus]